LEASKDSNKHVIRPNRSVWVLPGGQVVDVESEGATEDGAAFSHGIFVRKWVSFRLDRFFPDKADRQTAQRIRSRALELLRANPELESDPEDDGSTNPFSGDLAYNQAAEEEGWIRIKPLTKPLDNTIYAETATGAMSKEAKDAIHGAAAARNCRLIVLSGGALANRAKDVAA
jgi:hypothetical protein